jgi:hypothetical protein
MLPTPRSSAHARQSGATIQIRKTSTPLSALAARSPIAAPPRRIPSRTRSCAPPAQVRLRGGAVGTRTRLSRRRRLNCGLLQRRGRRPARGSRVAALPRGLRERGGRCLSEEEESRSRPSARVAHPFSPEVSISEVEAADLLVGERGARSRRAADCLLHHDNRGSAAGRTRLAGGVAAPPPKRPPDVRPSDDRSRTQGAPSPGRTMLAAEQRQGAARLEESALLFANSAPLPRHSQVAEAEVRQAGVAAKNTIAARNGRPRKAAMPSSGGGPLGHACCRGVDRAAGR